MSSLGCLTLDHHRESLAQRQVARQRAYISSPVCGQVCCICVLPPRLRMTPNNEANVGRSLNARQKRAAPAESQSRGIPQSWKLCVQRLGVKFLRRLVLVYWCCCPGSRRSSPKPNARSRTGTGLDPGPQAAHDPAGQWVDPAQAPQLSRRPKRAGSSRSDPWSPSRPPKHQPHVALAFGHSCVSGGQWMPPSVGACKCSWEGGLSR